MTHARALLRARRRGARRNDPRVAVVLADIGAGADPATTRARFNVGIREQLMIGVAAGLALEGYRPIVHSYAPFLVERPYEQIKLDLGHQDLGAVLVSSARRTTRRREGRTHQAPEDVARARRAARLDDRGARSRRRVERMLARALGTTTASTSG